MKKTLLSTYLLTITGIELLAQEMNESSGMDNSLLTIVSVIAVLGVIALFISMKKISQIKKEYKKLEDDSKSIEEQQNELLSEMSTEIQTMVKQAIGSTSEIASKNKSNEINKDLDNVLQAENQLLDITNDLIEFIHLKAKKVQISSNKYVLDNLLNDITGFVSKNFHIKSLEITYRIDNSIPEELIGDTLKISKILYNLLDYSIRNGATKLLVHVNKSPGFQSDNELTFSIHSNIAIDVENDAFFFKTQYDEEKNKYDSLGLFVAKEFATLMNGELIARNDTNGDLEFIFSTSFHYPDDYTRRKIDESLLYKKTLIVEDNEQYAAALQEMLETYEHKISIFSSKFFLEQPSVLHNYNLVILNENIFTAKVIDSLEKIKKETDITVVALSNFFNPSNSKHYKKIADCKLLKPTIRGTLRDLLERAYLSKEAKEVSNAQQIRNTSLKIHREEFKRTPNVSSESFTLFKDYKLLVVEDDAINQKVIQGVLRRSGMEIDLANNGEECLKLLKKKPYDIILMDINMPTMDGYTATRTIRSDSKYDAIPIIALTTLTSTDEIHKMFNIGMNAHLAKPFHKGNLFSAFSIYLKSSDEAVIFTKPETKKVVKYEGLDVKQGILQVNNNEEFYKEILGEFLEMYKESPTYYEKLIHDLRYEQVRIYCLDIKGLSGLIGATELHNLMADIHHQLIFKKFDTLGEYVESFHKTVNTLSVSIKEYIES